jgi:hypothetical protein
MATKTEASPRKKYTEMQFQVDDAVFCCGIAQVGMFEPTQGVYDYANWKYKEADKKYATKREQAEACYEQIIERTSPKGPNGAYAQVLISLVSKYKNRKKNTHQWPELEDILKEKGWTEHSRFINPNHGNEVVLYGMKFPDREKLKPGEVYTYDREPF